MADDDRDQMNLFDSVDDSDQAMPEASTPSQVPVQRITPAINASDVTPPSYPPQQSDLKPAVATAEARDGAAEPPRPQSAAAPFRGMSRRRWTPGKGAGNIAASNRLSARATWIGRGLVVALSLIMVGLLVRVAVLQYAPSPAVAELIDTQVATGRIEARRGAVTDRRGRLLAASRPAVRLFIDPYLIDDRGTFSERVYHQLGYDPIAIERAMHDRPSSRYIVIDHEVSEGRLAKLRSSPIPGLATEEVLVRSYPMGSLAGQLIGFVGRDQTGLEGIELVGEQRMGGEAGQYRVMRDSRRRSLWIRGDGYQPQHDGQPIQLTIDSVIQSVAETQLAAAVRKYKAVSGQVVVMDPHTGQILALANVPLFDPSASRNNDLAKRRNRAVTDVFEPGSIFKPFVWATLLERGVVRLDEMIDCESQGWWRTDFGRTLRDSHGHGRITWRWVLAYSSNIGMGKVAMRIDHKQLHDDVARFGFGKTTGSKLPGEIPGLLRPADKWTDYSQTSIPMGQEIAVTALQITRAFAAFANDGLLVEPTIFMPQTQAEHDASLMTHRILKPTTARTVRKTLELTVNEGTGRRAKSKRTSIFGKTGTAQLPDFENGGYHQDRYVASFVGGAPADRPRLVVGCFIQDPDRSVGHYGGIVSAPVVKAVIERSLDYLNAQQPPVRSQPVENNTQPERERTTTTRTGLAMAAPANNE